MWLALTPANVSNGTMRYARGSHRDGLLEHALRGDGVADVMRGEEVLVDIDPDSEVVVQIEPGEDTGAAEAAELRMASST